MMLSTFCNSYFRNLEVKISQQDETDVRFDVYVQDYLNIQVGNPAAYVNTLKLEKPTKNNFSEIRDFIRSSAS